MSKRLYCPDCDNTGRFTVTATEQHTWRVDGNKNFIVDVDCGDSKMGDDFRCDNCCQPVNEYEFCDGCNRLMHSCTCRKSVSHETKARVAMSFYVDISTESHPEDIDKDTMDEIIRTHALDYIKQLTIAEELDSLIDEYLYEEIKQVEE